MTQFEIYQIRQYVFLNRNGANHKTTNAFQLDGFSKIPVKISTQNLQQRGF